MKKLLILVLAGATILTGCKRGPQAPFERTDAIIIHGTYHDENGDAFASKWVGFWINSTESFFTNFMGLDSDENTITDSTGKYQEDFMGRDLMDAQGATYQVVVMNCDPDWPDTCPQVRCDFYPLSTDITAPTMKLWRGNPTGSVTSDTHFAFSWAKLSTTHDTEPENYEFRARATQDGAEYSLWRQDMGSDTSLNLPAYILPKAYFQKWKVIADIPAPSVSDYGFAYLSDPTVTISADTSLRLLSLGKNCYAEAYPLPFPKATDGRWGPWASYAVSFLATNVSWVYVDLGDTNNTVNAVVVYDIVIVGNPQTPGYDVYVSNDNSNWGTAIASTTKKNGYFYVEGFSKKGRYVKLQAKDNNIGITGFREIGVFGN